MRKKLPGRASATEMRRVRRLTFQLTVNFWVVVGISCVLPKNWAQLLGRCVFSHAIKSL